jgi:hypothetical protein
VNRRNDNNCFYWFIYIRRREKRYRGHLKSPEWKYILQFVVRMCEYIVNTLFATPDTSFDIINIIFICLRYKCLIVKLRALLLQRCIKSWIIFLVFLLETDIVSINASYRNRGSSCMTIVFKRNNKVWFEFYIEVMLNRYGSRQSSYFGACCVIWLIRQYRVHSHTVYIHTYIYQ